MNLTIHNSDNLVCLKSSPILELSVKFTSQIYHENINKPLNRWHLFSRLWYRHQLGRRVAILTFVLYQASFRLQFFDVETRFKTIFKCSFVHFSRHEKSAFIFCVSSLGSVACTALLSVAGCAAVLSLWQAAVPLSTERLLLWPVAAQLSQLLATKLSSM